MTRQRPANRRQERHVGTRGVRARGPWLAALLAVLFGLPLPGARAEDPPSLAVATYGGAYGQSQEMAFFEPFTQATGTKISMDIYDGTLAAIKDKIAASPSAIDVVDLSAGALDALCHDGLLEPIDSSILDAAGAGQSAAEDFLPGALPSCGLASVAWSTTIAFDRNALTKAQPSSVGDLLDTRRFPGKRALPDGPRYTLELALLADGVQPENVYSELTTPAGVDRAFKALDKIRADIVWWDKAEEPVSWLLEKKAVMAAVYSGRMARAAIGAPQLNIIWDGQVYDLDLWAIAKNSANKDAAKRFIAFALEPPRLAAQAQLIGYGPMRKSAIALVGKHPIVDVDMKTYLPTAPDHMKKALKFDAGWWSEHGEELANRFKSWREQAATAEGTQQEGTPSQAQ